MTRNDDHTIEWRTRDCELRIRFTGDLRFTEDFRTIAGLARGTTLRVIESGPVDRELTIRDGANGALSYAFEVEGRDQPWNADGEAWLESVVLQLFRRSGYGADDRSQYILRRHGPDGVFAEMEQMDGDYPRHVYSAALLRHSGSDPALQVRVLESATGWSSDYYKSELLDALTGRSSDARVLGAGWKLAGSLESDYYATKGIQRLLSTGEPGAAGAEVALAALDGIKSDYYRAELLKTISRDVPLEGRVVPLYLTAAERTTSDYYRAEMLGALVDRSPLSKEHLLAAIRATKTMKSDYYQSQVLSRIARKHDLSGDALEAYMDASDAIGSSHYRGEALSSLRRSGKIVSQ